MSQLIALKGFIELSALEAGKLTPFGTFTRWLFAKGMKEYFEKQGNKDAIDAIAPVVDKAWTYVQENAMKMYGIPIGALQYPRDPNWVSKHYTMLNAWFNNYIKDIPSVPSDEKEVFKQAIFMFKYAQIGFPNTRIDTLDKIAKAMSKKLGLISANYLRLKKGTEKEFSGKAHIDDLYTELESIVKKLTKKSGTRIPADLRKELKLKNGSEVQDLIRYDDIRKELKRLTDSSLYAIVSDSNMEADKAAKEMERQGFRDFPFPTSEEGYTGYIGLDKQGKLAMFTPGGKLIQGMVAPGSKVKMNPKYNEELDNTFYFVFRAPNAVSDSRGYTVNFKAIKTDEKHTKTETHADKVGLWVKAWERDLLNKDPMRHVPAAVAMLLYLTSARIGTSKDNRSLKGGAHTYGISTLRKQHVRVSGASIILDYVGKKGMHQKHTLKLDTKVNKRIATILKRLLEGKRKDDLVFSFVRPTSRQGTMQEVNPAFFRSYLKSTGVTINPHALRHIRGTELTKELLAAKEWKPSIKAKTLSAKQREAEAYIKEKILTQVANLLGHKSMKNGTAVPAWRTSIQSYINPAPIIEWFKGQRLEVPKWVPLKLNLDA